MKSPGRGLALLRAALGAAGLLLLGVGARHLARLRDPLDALEWLAGAVLLHDAVLAPLIMAAGLLVTALPARRVLRAVLMTGGALTLVALPALLRPGPPANPSVLPLPYGRNLLLLLGLALLAGVTSALIARGVRRGRRRREGRR